MNGPLPLFPFHDALISEGGHQGRYPRGGTTMKSIRTFVLAAIAAASFAATAHSASAQMLYANTPVDHVLPFEAIGTINAVILPSAGTYVFSGYQAFIVEGSQPTTISCWLSTIAGSRSGMLTYGPLVSASVQTGGYVTLPLNGYYVASGRTEVWVECEYVAPSTATIVQSLTGILMATSVQN
jgi:hypothetical protein